MSASEHEGDAFCQAVAAIDAGEVEQLERVLATYPQLVADRLDGSPAWLRRQLGDAAEGFSRPYLLWFVAEDHEPPLEWQQPYSICSSAFGRPPGVRSNSVHSGSTVPRCRVS